jgi:hypothetical protein
MLVIVNFKHQENISKILKEWGKDVADPELFTDLALYMAPPSTDVFVIFVCWFCRFVVGNQFIDRVPRCLFNA